MTASHDSHQGLPSPALTWLRLRHNFFLFSIASTIVWLLLYSVYVALPFVRNGADAISASKVHFLETQPVFTPNAKARVLAFGNSRILAAFDPAIYSPAIAQDVESFNAARPGNSRFMDLLKSVLANGTRPTHVLLQFPPQDDDHRETWRDYLLHDKLLVNLLFPFREFPRDLTLFLLLSRNEGGIIHYYKENALTVRRVITDRGYYFIKGQSHYPGDRLPDDYHVPTDQPKRVPARPIDPETPGFKELIGLSAEYGFKVIFIPNAYRVGEVAPPGASDFAGTKPIPSLPGFYIAGPDYWVFEQRCFSDPIHLNREGASVYSRRLAEITASVINGQD